MYRDKEVLLFQLKSVYRDEEGQELMEPEELIHAALYEGQSFVFCITQLLQLVVAGHSELIGVYRHTE